MKCIAYINYIRNIERYVQRINLTSNITATELAFIVNVGKFNNGKTYVGSDINAGCHWTLAVYHMNANTIFYADSLGWEFPENLHHQISSYVSLIYQLNDPLVQLLHDPNLKDGNGNHVCIDMKCKNYPLQKCFNVCGVITIMMTAITCLSPEIYTTTLTMQEINYLQNPTKYNKFLRQVIMCWLAEDNIKIDNIVSQHFPLADAEYEGEESSEEYQYFEIADEIEETKGEEIEVEKVEGKTKEERPKEESNRKTHADTKNTKEKKQFRCHLCGQTATRSTTLRRHMDRKHKDVEVKTQDGTQINKCVCARSRGFFVGSFVSPPPQGNRL